MTLNLLSPCQFQEEIRKSRFLALAAPVDSPAAAQAFIQAHSDGSASHNCWAWKVGAQYRFSDDGEPGGTAGRPILAAIEGQGFDQVVVLVIRWYGGIQLGTGGLARAYGGSAAKCLQSGQAVTQVLRSRCQLHCSFAELPLLKARLDELQALLESETFDAEGALLQLALPESQMPALEQLLANLSRGRSRVQRL